MMATVQLSSSSLLPLLESLEDEAAGASEQTDAYLTIANRLSGEDGRQFFPIILKHFSRLGKSLQTHISSENEELSQAALQALGFCVFNTNIVSGIPAKFAEDILSALCALVLRSTDKNTCTRALWVISKQNFPAEVLSKKTPEILKMLDAMQTKDIQSILMDHESLNVVIKLQEQAPTEMTEGAVTWAKMVIPLVVHTASKVRLRAAAALELGLPLLLEKQMDVAAIVEPMMSSKLIPEMQKLFSTKNESNVLKLWPLFVKLLGKLLHKGGAFINSLLYLEELGFRSSSPTIKKIAFIAWKSLIDNFALNPEILCSSKRLKLLMQPLSSILVRTEALLLTKLEVWWYLVVKLGPNLAINFDQVGVPLLHNTLPPDGSLPCPATPARGTSQSNGIGLATPKTGVPSCSSPATTPRMNLSNSSISVPQSYTSIQLLGLEMLLHYFLGTQTPAAATKNKLQLSLEPLTHNLLSSHSFFSKHSSTLISAVKNGFVLVGKDAPEALLSLIWNSLVNHISVAVEAAGNKKERQGSEMLTLLLQTLQSILSSEALPAPQALALLESTVKGIPQKVLGSAAYQVANMDVLNGTPALFLILLFYNNSLLSSFVTDEKFFLCLETLVSCGLCGPTSPLAFGEAVLGAVSRNGEAVKNKEHLWRMWSVVVNPLTDTITQTNEVNQGDALEHNFSAIHSALMFPITHLLPGSALPQMTQKSMLSTWSRLYKAFARCSALVATAEENVCCEELCARISATLDAQALKSLSTLDAIANILFSIIESVDFSPFTAQFQQKMKSPHTPLGWVRKRSKALGNLSSFHVLLVQSLEAFLALNTSDESSVVLSGVCVMLVSIVSTLFSNLALPTVIQESLASLTKPLALVYGQVGSSESEQSKSHSVTASKLEKLLGEMLGCLQSRSALQYDDDLLSTFSPLLSVCFLHKSKHIRSAVTQFWNATFGNALVLTYPETLKPVLSQAKQKAPLILPGFHVAENSEDLDSGPCSSECSQLDTKISGITVTSVGKRESLLAKATELKEKNSGTSKPVSIKLDFGSPKPPRRGVLEEEASVDFVFIPPEAKERVLTEHQKEVKRSKRDDIPAMYNNLDASMDTTVFTQYTQSQEESMDKLKAEGQPETQEMDESKSKDVVMEESSESDVKEHQDNGCPEMETNEANQTTEVPPSPEDVSMVDISGHEDSAKKDHSPNVSGSSDMISGTPPKPNSRRQSFITLEKYVEGKPSSPMGVTKFTGPLTRTSSSQETPTSQQQSPDASTGSQTEADQDSSNGPEADHEPSNGSQAEAGKEASEASRNITEPTNQVEEENVVPPVEIKPVAKCSSEGTEDEDDVIPDTQSETLNEVVNDGDKSHLEKENEPGSIEEDSEVLASSQASSQVEPRRSIRRRSKPVRPGEDSKDQEGKNKVEKKSHVDESLTDSQKIKPNNETENVFPGRSRRSRQVEENKGENGKLQSSESKEEPGQTDSQVSSMSSSPTQRRTGRRKTKELNQTEPSNTNSQSSLGQSDNEKEFPLSQSEGESQRRSSRRVKASPASLEGVSGKRPAEEASQSNSQDETDSELGKRSPGRLKKLRRSEAADAQSKDQVLENEKVSDLSQSDSQTLIPSKGRSSRRKRTEEEINTNKDVVPSGAIVSESSQTEESKESQGSSQERGKYNTRRASQGSLGSVENTQTDGSDTKGGQKSKKARGRRSLASEVVPETVQEDVPENLLEKEDADLTETSEKEPEASKKARSLVSDVVQENVPENMLEKEDADQTETSEKEPEALMDVSMLNDVTKEDTLADDKEELTAAQSPLNEHCVSEKLAEGEQKSDEMMEINSDKEEKSSVFVEKSVEEVKITPSQNSLVLPEKVTLKTPEFHRCPHTKRGRGRRRSANCNCFLDSGGVPSQESVCSEALQDMKEEEVVSPESNSIESELNEKPVLEDKETVADDCSAVVESSTALSNSTDTQMATESTDQVLEVSSDSKENSAQAEGDQTKNVDEPDDEHQVEELCNGDSENAVNLKQPQSLSLQEDCQEQSQAVEAETVCQEESESPVNQDETELNVNEAEEKLEMQENNDLMCEIGADGVAPLPEDTDLDNAPHAERDDGEETQIDNAAEETDLPGELSVPQSSTAEPCLDSPPKQKSTGILCGDLEVGQSPSSSSITRGVWSPSASPSTSILKKGQKRQFEEDTPSPLLKSRRVSFANPIYQQELADDIDRRSPVIRTSSPRSKAIGQPKYITTPTKGLLTLSPRNLRSPGYKSSKKCLISEMSQEPRPIPKDCVYPALVCCSTPVEAVLPQISSNMWPRGLGQLVRARNIKTVGDLSALTPSEIKLLPIRSPKLSNVKKALKIYHEQQRKGRPDELKGFDETEKLTSETEEMDVVPNQGEEQTSSEAQGISDNTEVVSAELSSSSEQKQEVSVSVDLLSDVAALGARLTAEELSRCSPKELSLMHEHLTGMTRSIVDNLQSRLEKNIEEPLL